MSLPRRLLTYESQSSLTGRARHSPSSRKSKETCLCVRGVESRAQWGCKALKEKKKPPNPMSQPMTCAFKALQE